MLKKIQLNRYHLGGAVLYCILLLLFIEFGTLSHLITLGVATFVVWFFWKLMQIVTAEQDLVQCTCGGMVSSLAGRCPCGNLIPPTPSRDEFEKRRTYN